MGGDLEIRRRLTSNYVIIWSFYFKKEKFISSIFIFFPTPPKWNANYEKVHMQINDILNFFFLILLRKSDKKLFSLI
jgi:hypothetical protein